MRFAARILASAAWGALLSAVSVVAADRPPNIVYIMVDDAGYGDFSRPIPKDLCRSARAIGNMAVQESHQNAQWLADPLVESSGLTTHDLSHSRIATPSFLQVLGITREILDCTLDENLH